MTRRHAASSSAFVVLALSLAAQDGRPPRTASPETMDYGPCLTTTLLARGTPGVTHKALIVRLPNGAAAFDTELLRMSAIWTEGWLELRGTAYDGAHGPMPRVHGRQLAAVRSGPGVAHAGEFVDPRAEPFGPLPREWGSYDGHWLCGNRVVFGYHLGDLAVKERADLVCVGEQPLAVRYFEFGPSTQDARLVLLDGPPGSQTEALDIDLTVGDDATAGVAIAAMQWPQVAAEPIELDGSHSSWGELSVGEPTHADWLDASSGTGATVRFVHGFRRPVGRLALADGTPEAATACALPVLHDGKAALRDDDSEARLEWQKGDDARLHIDLQQTVAVSRVSVFSRHADDRAVQRYELFASDAEVPPPLEAKDPAVTGWREVAEVDGRELGRGGMQASSLSRREGLGRCRHLLLVLRDGDAALTEIDVFADRYRAPVDGRPRPLLHAGVALRAEPVGAVTPRVVDGRIVLDVPKHAQTVRCAVFLATAATTPMPALVAGVSTAAPQDLGALVAGQDNTRWGKALATKGSRGEDDGAFAVDTIAIPFDNPFGSYMRVCGFDFFADGRAAITTWNGDVWIVSGLEGDFGALQWRRFATGLFDPLGLRIVDDTVYVHGRDGITTLRDRDGDGEADTYACFNHEVAVTNAFHEFAFDLQTDPEGNFYGSKGAPVNPGGRGFMRIARHHGTIFKIAGDGSSLEVVAVGLRAPNGIGVSPDGKVLTSGDNEGTWMPRCRLNWIQTPGYFAGVPETAHRRDVPQQPDLPLCWMPMEVDNSSGGQVWVTSEKWAPLPGRLLHLSYGTCSVYLVLKEDIDGVVQGGVVRLPCEFSSSALRARFHPRDGQLYVAGLQGWQTNAVRLGGFHRVRYTGQPLRLPVALRTCDRGVYLTFAEPLDRATAEDVANYGVEIWNYLYSKNYGSPELSILHPERVAEQSKPNRDAIPVTAARLSADGRTVFLAVAGMRPVMQMKIRYHVDAHDGGVVKGEVHNTIHVLTQDPGFPPVR